MLVLNFEYMWERGARYDLAQTVDLSNSLSNGDVPPGDGNVPHGNSDVPHHGSSMGHVDGCTLTSDSKKFTN